MAIASLGIRFRLSYKSKLRVIVGSDCGLCWLGS